MPKSKTCFRMNGKPKAVYFSKSEAESGAAYAKSKYGTDVEPYRCGDCGDYHLGPAREYCECSGASKILFEYYDEAEDWAWEWDQRVYACEWYEGWHCTSRWN